MLEKRVWVAGEALVDLIPKGDSHVSLVGGGPANTARAVARLGIPTSFIGGFSNDQNGALIRSELAQLDLSLSRQVNLPTALAILALADDGSAKYKFNTDNTATFDFSGNWLPVATPDVLYIGSLATIVEPGASALFHWARGLGVTIVYDPNVRLTFLSDIKRYCQAIERWIGISKVVKLSSEDMSSLGYFDVQRFFDLGAELVVVTNGALGITALTRRGSISVPGVQVEVVDTVGAGDTVGAILVEGLVKYGFDLLVGDKLFEVLTRAVKAAAITCSREGANAPTAEELV